MIQVVCNSPAVSEFTQGQQFDCGAAAVATMAWSTPNDGTPSRTDTQVEQDWFVQEYLHRHDVLDPNDQDSNSLADMHQYFQHTTLGSTPNRLSYWDYMTTPTYRQIVVALYRRYPTIVTVAEDSVFDVDLQMVPYPWHFGHIFAIVGLDPNGDYLVFDTANMDSGNIGGTIRQWPRRYSKDRLQFWGYGALVQLPWLPPLLSGDPFRWGNIG